MYKTHTNLINQHIINHGIADLLKELIKHLYFTYTDCIHVREMTVIFSIMVFIILLRRGEWFYNSL
jgi:hypothetical protein